MRSQTGKELPLAIPYEPLKARLPSAEVCVTSKDCSCLLKSLLLAEVPAISVQWDWQCYLWGVRGIRAMGRRVEIQGLQRTVEHEGAHAETHNWRTAGCGEASVSHIWGHQGAVPQQPKERHNFLCMYTQHWISILQCSNNQNLEVR